MFLLKVYNMRQIRLSETASDSLMLCMFLHKTEKLFAPVVYFRFNFVMEISKGEDRMPTIGFKSFAFQELQGGFKSIKEVSRASRRFQELQ